MIITDKNGRPRSIRTSDELDGIVKKIYGALSEEEKEMFHAMLQEYGDGAISELEGLVRQQKYKWDPVPMREFLEDDYYLGESSITLYPKLKQDLIDIFDGGYRWNDVALYSESKK